MDLKDFLYFTAPVLYKECLVEKYAHLNEHELYRYLTGSEHYNEYLPEPKMQVKFPVDLE
ncbi:hypothetical protein O9G_001844 [Rozella allomycis CSF55]|uniref:Uncharacterized protein n=1 Tax=Rozella allomycis (strain CSF55) TaxID=988480 RepID=A0A075AV87_ROZAC|nr:hypothetical protein O9G_001844 [Rozella allomycis CSF55]|eukprot:EPZ34231.1 hypothetical protein O9G_001844 [Rozella allomycis CSF55]